MSDFNVRLDLMKQVLDYRVANHAVKAANLANADTPNYIAKNMSFEAKLKQAEGDTEVSQGKEAHWEVSNTVENSRAPRKTDGNNVKAEQEMSALAENSLLYMSTLKIVSQEISLMRYAITSGGR